VKENIDPVTYLGAGLQHRWVAPKTILGIAFDCPVDVHETLHLRRRCAVHPMEMGKVLLCLYHDFHIVGNRVYDITISGDNS
jgi:hypothetical protein